MNFRSSFIFGNGYSLLSGEDSFFDLQKTTFPTKWEGHLSIPIFYTPEYALNPPSTGSTTPVTKLAARSSKSIAPISSFSSP